MKIASFPFAPGRIIFERSLFASYIVNFLGLSAHFSAIYYAPLYLQVRVTTVPRESIILNHDSDALQIVDNLSARDTGILMIPPMLGSVLGSVFGGRIMKRTGKYYRLTISCLFLSVLAALFLILSAGLFEFSRGLIIALFFSSFGIGATITTTLISVIANVDPIDQAVATACTYLFRSLGCTVGTSFASTVVQQVLRNQLRAHLDPGENADKIVQRVRQSLDYIKELAPHTRVIVIRCYENATAAAFGLTLSFTFLAFICSFWIREKRLSK
jgi:MFS family permease